MRCETDIYLAGTGVWLPELSSVQAAVDAGLVGEGHRGLGYESVAVADGMAAPDLAVRAARTAVARAGIAGDDYGLVLHASLWFQGLDMWASASYVAHAAVGPEPVAFDVAQRSNGGLGALHLATAYLSAGFAHTALVTTGDVFAPPGINRWGSQFYTIFGDAGTAVVLSTRGGFARIRATASLADNSLEPWGRGSTPFADAPGRELPVQVLRRAAEHAQRADAARSWERLEAIMLAVRDRVLDDAGVKLGEVSRAVLPFIHRGAGRSENYDALGFTEQQSLWGFGRTVGHLGAGDQIAGLDHLLATRAVRRGDLVLLFGVGVGFTVAATLIEIVADPA
ncbi:MAG TPA: ketoacyl-ACP synthase III family protein [Pilimelia sp.]|nr:ketoacyl-ACP synthase III family protein [Pilimelia sp.]